MEPQHIEHAITHGWIAQATKQFYVDAGANPSTSAVSATLYFSCPTCSTPNTPTLAISQGPSTFAIGPANATLYQGYNNPAITLPAYYNGQPQSRVAWSLSSHTGDDHIDAGTVAGTGIYTPPTSIPTNTTSINTI